MAKRSTITPGRLEENMKMLTMALIGVTLVTTGSANVSGGQMLPWSSNQMPGISQPNTMQLVEQQKLRIAERQKQLVQDTDKLLELTTALKEQVDDSNKNILSLDMVKKAEQIEKLAHSVKERIKG
jgi:hypothetical protein